LNCWFPASGANDDPQVFFDDLKPVAGCLRLAAALRLIELTRRDDVSIDELARAMQADPALSGRLVRFASPALDSPRRPVASVADAIRRIGINSVRQLVLGFSVLDNNRTGSCRSFDYPRFWSRSLATAIAAHALCLRVRIASADEAFACGLLSGVGSLALAALYPGEYSAVLDSLRDAVPGQRAAVEHREFNVDHGELGATLLEDWKLPRLSINAILYHENPDAAKAAVGSRENGLVQVLALAAGLGDYCVASDAARKAAAPALVLDAARWA
jgi:HD-like signal output (HDOD) protein